jgi:hypothetical protein
MLKSNPVTNPADLDRIIYRIRMLKSNPVTNPADMDRTGHRIRAFLNNNFPNLNPTIKGEDLGLVRGSLVLSTLGED